MPRYVFAIGQIRTYKIINQETECLHEWKPVSLLDTNFIEGETIQIHLRKVYINIIGAAGTLAVYQK